MSIFDWNSDARKLRDSDVYNHRTRMYAEMYKGAPQEVHKEKLASKKQNTKYWTDERKKQIKNGTIKICSTCNGGGRMSYFVQYKDKNGQQQVGFIHEIGEAPICSSCNGYGWISQSKKCVVQELSELMGYKKIKHMERDIDNQVIRLNVCVRTPIGKWGLTANCWEGAATNKNYKKKSGTITKIALDCGYKTKKDLYKAVNKGKMSFDIFVPKEKTRQDIMPYTRYSTVTILKQRGVKIE